MVKYLREGSMINQRVIATLIAVALMWTAPVVASASHHV
jgi:hypothetical protein